MTQPTHIRAMGDDTENAHTVTATRQVVYRAHSLDKVELLSRVLQAKDRGLTLIFTRTKRAAAKVSDELVGRRHPRGPRPGRPRAGDARLPQWQS